MAEGRTTRARASIIAIRLCALVVLALLAHQLAGVRRSIPDWLIGRTYAAVATNCAGDVNQDGARDVRDLVALQGHILEKKLLTGLGLDAADINSDGKVDVLDVSRLEAHVTRRQLLPECVVATMTVSPASLNFENVASGQSKDLNVIIGNTGAAVLTVNGLTSTNAMFSVPSPIAPFAVPAGGQQVMVVRFRPSTAGAHTGTLGISGTSNGAVMSASVALAGTSISPPVLTSISPATATQGSGAFTLTARGTNFVSGATILWDGAAKSTTFVSSTELTAQIPASDLASDETRIVTVVNSAGSEGSQGLPFYISPNTPPPRSGAYIRYIVPAKAPAGSRFTLFGKGFSPVASANTVTFTLDGVDTAASVVSATENAIVATVPGGVQNGKEYFVTATVNGRKTNFVGFQAAATAAPLEIYPSSSSLLMPPGSAKEFLVIGGGTPPYKLKPLSAADQGKVSVELKGNVVEVTGLNAGQSGATSATIAVEDSASSPASEDADVRVQVPKFEPTIDIIPHNLLAGSSPGFTIRVRTSFAEMRIGQMKIRIGKAGADFSALQAGDLLGATSAEGDFGLMRAVGVNSSDKVSFEMFHYVPETLEDLQAGRTFFQVFADGTLQRDSGGVTLLQSEKPSPVPEAIFNSGLDSEVILGEGVVRLPADGDVSFDITTTFTSVSVFEGRYLPMTKVVTKTFRTVAPAAGAPRITRVAAIQGEILRAVEIEGSGFSSTPADNKVTFQGTEVAVASASTNKLKVFVPSGITLGDSGETVQVIRNNLTSNTHWFRVLFRPDGSLVFPEFKAGIPATPLLTFGQPADRVRFAKATAVLDAGTLNAGGLVKDQPAGTALWGNTPLQLFYKEQEASGARRHVFQIAEPGGSFPRAQLFVSENAGGKGITFEFAFIGNNQLNGAAALIQFSKAIVVPPAKGTVVNTSVKFQSARWIFFADSEMVVTFKRKVIAE